MPPRPLSVKTRARGRVTPRRKALAAPMALAPALLLTAALIVLPPGRPAGKEREFPTIIALGGVQPLHASEGLFTPLVVADHESGGYYGEGTLRFRLFTAAGWLGMTHPAGRGFAMEYRTRARVAIEGDGSALYTAGNRRSAHTFWGDSLALILAAHHRPRPAWRLSLEMERQWTRFRDSPYTGAGFVLPSDFTQDESRFLVTRTGLLGADDAELTITLAAGRRRNWHDWSLERDAGERADYRKQTLRWEQPADWGGGQRGKGVLTLLDGVRLDLFSGYAVGGLAGDYPVGGYFRNEFRARRAAILNLTYEMAFSEERVLSLYGDAARLREQRLDLDGYDPAIRTLASLGIGYYHALRGLGGLPLILRFSEGLLIPKGWREGGRREVMLVVAAGF